MKTGEIHYRKYDTCVDLQRLLQLLIEAGSAGISTREIIQRTGLCAISALASELRANRIPVPDAEQRGKRFYYYPPPPGHWNPELKRWELKRMVQAEMEI